VAKTGPEVLLVRHGQTEWSLSGQHTGTTDIPLTDEGRRQGELLRGRLAGREFERVLSSPLSRALETCRLVGLGDQVEVREELREWDYGSYEGRTTADIRGERPDWYLWRDGCPGGETAAEIGARVDTVVAELRELEGDAAIFAHGHLLRVLAVRWLELPPEAGGHFGLSTATLSIVGREREVPAMWLWNGAAHLAHDTGAQPAS
jgi:probable phosphoglycerate mutase